MEAGNTSQIEHKGVVGEGGCDQSLKVLEDWSRNCVNIVKYI
jgi:hypothetical protein